MTHQLELLTGERRSPSPAGRLDEHTRAVGRAGLSQARAALAESARRAAERQAARLARRDDELARRAAAARRRGHTEDPPVRHHDAA
jgi:hypothetical protein